MILRRLRGTLPPPLLVLTERRSEGLPEQAPMVTSDGKGAVTFAGYSDASGSGADRFRSVAVVSGELQACLALSDRLQAVAADEAVRTVEWKFVKGDAGVQRATEQYVNLGVTCACRGEIRVDVLTWDTYDSRHAVPGRDDTENLARMYYHLLVHAAQRGGGGTWRLCADEDASLGWSALLECLERTQLIRRSEARASSLFRVEGERMVVESFRECDSCGECLIQLSDIFAGLGRWSHEKAKWLPTWVENLERRAQVQKALFDDMAADGVTGESRSDRARSRIVHLLDRLCKSRKLGVSLRTKGCLWTPGTRGPVNFWTYDPQSSLDVAPRRRERSGPEALRQTDET